MSEENPRWVAARSVYGPGMRNWQFINFINRAKRFAFDHGFGVAEHAGFKKYYNEPQTYVFDHDLFTIACEWYAWELRTQEQGGLW